MGPAVSIPALRTQWHSGSVSIRMKNAWFRVHRDQVSSLCGALYISCTCLSNLTSLPSYLDQHKPPSIPCTTLLHKQSKLDFLLPLQWPGSALRAIRCNASDKLCFSKVLSQGHICWRIYCIIGFSPHVRWVICCVQLRFKKEPEVVLRWWWWEALSAAADTWGETGAPPLYHLCWIHHLSCGK